MLQQQAQTTNDVALSKGAISFFGSAGDGAEADKLKAAATSSDIVVLLNTIIFEGIDRGCSDIHIEPERNTLVIGYRIDGRLVVRPGDIPIAAHLAIVSRLKVLCPGTTASASSRATRTTTCAWQR